MDAQSRAVLREERTDAETDAGAVELMPKSVNNGSIGNVSVPSRTPGHAGLGLIVGEVASRTLHHAPSRGV